MSRRWRPARGGLRLHLNSPRVPAVLIARIYNADRSRCFDRSRNATSGEARPWRSANAWEGHVCPVPYAGCRETEYDDRHILHDQARSGERCVLARDFIAEQQRVFNHSGQRSQSQMNGTHLDASLARFVQGSIHYAHRDGEFVHASLLISRVGR